MKMLPVTIGGLGAAALLLGVLGRLLNIQTMVGTTPGGFVRGATALFLLTLVVMVYDHWYSPPASRPPEAKT